MKKIVKIVAWCILLLFPLVPIKAEYVESKKASLVGQNFINKKVQVNKEISSIIAEKYEEINAFYILNFKEGGWVMVSAESNTIPILAFGDNGSFDMGKEIPGGLLDLMNRYKMEIAYARTLKSTTAEISKQWTDMLDNNWEKGDSLLSKNTNLPKRSSGFIYEPGDNLLYDWRRGRVQWGQSSNNDGGCSPAYNTFCNWGPCSCNNKTPVGCGAVAMGQIMWRWKWPPSSTYRTYDWTLMPDELLNGSGEEEGNQVAHLLKDCGWGANMFYSCLGSFTTTNNIESCFNDHFQYESAQKHLKENWPYGNAWCDLLCSEINAGRPVFYRGDKYDLSTEKHYFVICGYQSVYNPYYFYINWGWKGTYNDYYYLYDLTPGDWNDQHDYNKNQMAIVGISPTYPEIAPDQVNIYDVPYTTITGSTTIEAQQNIVLPATSKTLSVTNGGELTMIAGNSISLLPGFQAVPGSTFSASIDPEYTNELDVIVPTWYNEFIIEDGFSLIVENANSWEFTLSDMNSNVIFQSAGNIDGNTVDLWDGAQASCNSSYLCRIRFKNNNGRFLENNYTLTARCNQQNVSTVNEHVSDNENTTYLIKKPFDEDILIYPNPGNGLINIKLPNQLTQSIKIYNPSGILIYEDYDIGSTFYRVNFESSPKGIYIITIEIDKHVITRKLILE